MSCNGGIDPKMIEMIVSNAIQKLIDSGKLQAGLKGCDTNPLKEGTEVAKCEDIAPGLKDAKIEDNKLVLELTDGKTITVDLCEFVPKICAFYPSVQLNVEGSTCGSTMRVGYGFHPEDLRDPKATEIMADCKGNARIFLYKEEAAGHTIPVYSGCGSKAEIIGYAANAPVVYTNEACC